MKNILFFFIILASFGCNSDTPNISKQQESKTGFTLLDNENTKISFNNKIEESLAINTLSKIDMLQGAGVAVLDINNDGKQDIFFAGNIVGDQLYLNEGDFKFKNITQPSGFGQSKTWSSGVSIVDINYDGFDDIYISKYLYDDPNFRQNELWVNNKNNTFTEQAKAYGINDSGYTITSTFFDYDNDGDLDLYVGNQPPSTKNLKKQVKPTDYQFTDRLYRFDGNNKYVDVTQSSGITNVTYTLSATAFDYNSDGYLDLYVASDYEEADILYKNNGNGTFTNTVSSSIKHMSNFSMGADAADINNDGYLDLLTVDMVAEDNFRNKTNMSSMDSDKFWGLVKAGYQHQYMFNSLQINNGNGTFSEIAQMAGVSKTDWSWSSLFLDADHDGYKDLFVTNGIVMEIRNKDYHKNRQKYIDEKYKTEGRDYKFTPQELTKFAPSQRIPNKSYKNDGDLTFSNVTSDWGMDKDTWSHGMAYADFDNDGDLDLVINNSNDPADIYRNDNDSNGNYIAVKVEGMPKNKRGINTHVKIEYGNGEIQVSDINPYRGYMSSSEPIAHFGLGSTTTVNKLTVVFSDGKVMEKNNLKSNQTLTIAYSDQLPSKNYNKSKNGIVKPKKNSNTIVYNESEHDDYQVEILIPYKMSNLGPTMCSSDVDGDGLDDFYIGGAAGIQGMIYYQTDSGDFSPESNSIFNQDSKYEDSGCHFFDADGDGDLDLYVASGSNEFNVSSGNYQDRLYINQGDRKFTKSKGLPKIDISSSAICTLDYDKDGDLDLFVGGRQIPGGYGRKASSLILENKNGIFTDITNSIAPQFRALGMITSAHWTDIDGDKSNELVVSGEWMPITIFDYSNSKFVKAENSSLAKSNGLWNTMTASDLDNDGDIDLIAGNYGTNYKYKASESAPFELYVDDFDKNGSNDVYLGYVDESDGKLYPVRGRQCSSEQMPFVEDKFEDYSEFGKATVYDVLDGKLENTNIEKAYTFAHTLFINDGNGNFESTALPNTTQISSVYDIEITDFDSDGNKDIICVGNFHNREAETTRSDAGIGAVLLGDGKSNFDALPTIKSGFFADQDARALAILKNKQGKLLLAVANNGSEMQFFESN